MNAFTLQLRDATHAESIEAVTSFVGEDASGSFGILAGHARFMTSLVVGLARFRVGDNPWRYLAAPGALLYFVDNQLFLSTRHYVVDDDYERITNVLGRELRAEEQALHSVKHSLRRMEEELFKRMWRLRREAGG
jgi:F-type H+-transporting ATPase subunit epsilon